MTTADSAIKKQENLQTELSSLKHQMECKTKEIVKIKHELENSLHRQSADLQIFEHVVKSFEERVQQFGLYNTLLLIIYTLYINILFCRDNPLKWLACCLTIHNFRSG